MSFTTRRDLLKWGLGAGILSSVPAARATERTDKDRPRYFLSVQLTGGIDAIYTADPKSRAQVESWVDVPYRSSEILSAGKLQLGPLFAPLAPLASRLAFVNGVQVGTANHITGRSQFLRMATGPGNAAASVLGFIGKHRDTQAVGLIDARKWVPHGRSIFSILESFSPEDAALMSQSLRKQRQRLLDTSPATAGTLEETASLIERMQSVPKFREETWSEEPTTQWVAVTLQRALWAFKNDLTRSFFAELPEHNAFDSHNFNAHRQRASANATIPMLARFFSALETTSNQYGKLADTTVAVFGSELGRYPRINGSDGKDHFPEIPLVFYGSHFSAQAGVYGATDKRMMGVPVSLKTGMAESGGHALVLDDIGATLLHLGGVADPRVYGSTGTILRFLV